MPSALSCSQGEEERKRHSELSIYRKTSSLTPTQQPPMKLLLPSCPDMESPELLLWVVVGPELLVWEVGPGSWFGWWGLAPGMGGGAWLLVWLVGPCSWYGWWGLAPGFVGLDSNRVGNQ
ncbi:unnamed protein product [Arctogadus glacialis]